jgi:DNA-binding transcriptional regulator GbsR (MarR family)
MSLDGIKKDFVMWMDNIHTGLLFPKNYFGCMMAIYIEQEPIPQDRIKELTGYSKTTISQMLKIIRVNFPVTVIKKTGSRKKYFTIEMGTREFMLYFLTMIINSYKDKIDFFVPLIAELEPYTEKHPRFKNFKKFLETYYKFSTLFINLLVDTADDLRELIEIGKIKSSDLSDIDFLSSQENLIHIQNLLNPPATPPSFSDQRILDNQLAKIYTQLKNKYYQKFRENLTIARSQSEVARAIIATELLLEQRPVTQKEIEQATSFQRSTISSALKELLERKMIQLIKKPRDRKKYYLAVQSWDTRTINRFKLNTNYAKGMKAKIKALIEMVETASGLDEQNSLVEFFQQIYYSYDQFEQYFKLLELKFLNIRLKEHLNQNKS